MQRPTLTIQLLTTSQDLLIFTQGFEGDAGKLAYYVQGGRTINAVDGSDSESVTTGKIGGSVAANEKLGVYGEVSFANLFNEDTDNTYGTKLGAKFSFQ